MAFLLFSSYSLGGDTDLDLDGELDMDVVSFKGPVHFVMGASGWLCIKHSVSHSIEWYDYLIAVFFLWLYFTTYINFV